MNKKGISLPDIKELLSSVGIQSWSGQINQIAHKLPTDFDSAFTSLIELDRSIPGLGQHNINERTANGSLTGIYCIEDRPIFRGIQYVGMHLGLNNLEWLTRMIIIDSCYHVENALKRKSGITGRLSIGMILNRTRHFSPLDQDLTDALMLLNRAIYNKAKHTIEDISMDDHMFSVGDAIAVYLICRILGCKLLKGSGITTEHGEIVFP